MPRPTTAMAAMVATGADAAAMAAATARGRPSPTAAMVATDVVAMVATVMGAGTTVELRSNRSELSLYEIDLFSMKVF